MVGTAAVARQRIGLDEARVCLLRPGRARWFEHPRIARLYDAGVTASGRPWLAMECVSGVPIDVYCRELTVDTTGIHDTTWVYLV